MDELFSCGRILLGCCFLGDVVWMAFFHDVRIVYMDEAGAPHSLVWLSVVVYFIFGLSLIANYKVYLTALPLAAMVYVMSFALLSNVNGVGIGDYPPAMHEAAILHEWVGNFAVIGALIFLSGQTFSPTRNMKFEPVNAIGIIGRVLMGLYFFVIAIWQWHYREILLDLLPIGEWEVIWRNVSLGLLLLIESVGGALLAVGFVRSSVIMSLIIVTLFLGVIVCGDFGAPVSFPIHFQAYQWLMKASILAGLLLIFGHHRQIQNLPV